MEKFDKKLEQLEENYLTAGMQGSVNKKHSGGEATASPDANATKQSVATNDTADIITPLLLRANDSDDGLDGLDELDEYINSLKLDRTKLSSTFSELSNRLKNGQI